VKSGSEYQAEVTSFSVGANPNVHAQIMSEISKPRCKRTEGHNCFVIIAKGVDTQWISTTSYMDILVDREDEEARLCLGRARYPGCDQYNSSVARPQKRRVQAAFAVSHKPNHRRSETECLRSYSLSSDQGRYNLCLECSKYLSCVTWILDSGATEHMCPEHVYLYDFSLLNCPYR